MNQQNMIEDQEKLMKKELMSEEGVRE